MKAEKYETILATESDQENDDLDFIELERLEKMVDGGESEENKKSHRGNGDYCKTLATYERTNDVKSPKIFYVYEKEFLDHKTDAFIVSHDGRNCRFMVIKNK